MMHSFLLMKLKLNKILLLGLLLTISFQGCLLFKKELKSPVAIKIIEEGATIHIESNLNYTKYVNNYSKETILNEFMKGFNEEAGRTKNLTIVYNDNIKADYNLVIKTIRLTEKSKLETINNEKSELNGQQFELHEVTCDAEVELIKLSEIDAKPLRCFNSKQKSEKLKNNRNLSDLLSGTNKDNSIYRTKLMPAEIGLTLTQDVGRRIWVPITKKLSKKQK